MEDKLILVNTEDQEIGTMGKLEVHQKGLLHRAFSVFLFNDKGELLLQRRSLDKYHAAGLWSNTCCSHQHPGESTLAAATRRLKQELHIENVRLSEIFSFTYKATFDNGLIEHEYDHILIGLYNAVPSFNRNEIDAVKFIAFDELVEKVTNDPKEFTPWFNLIYQQVFGYYQQNKSSL